MTDTNADRLAVVVRTACADGCRWPQCRNSPDCSAVLHLSEDVIAALDGFDAARAREGVTEEIAMKAHSRFCATRGNLAGMRAALEFVAPLLAPCTPATHKDTLMTEDQIKHMVDRFLSWRLPEDFNPDAGISYSRPNYHPSVDATPTGTNLLNAAQADAMVRHLIDGVFSVAPRTPMPAQVTGPMVRRATEAFIGPSWQQSQHTAFVETERRIERAIQTALDAAPNPEPRTPAVAEAMIEPAPGWRSVPLFQTDKGVQFLAKDSDGQWYYVNHAKTWQACPPPFPSAPNVSAAAVINAARRVVDGAHGNGSSLFVEGAALHALGDALNAARQETEAPLYDEATVTHDTAGGSVSHAVAGSEPPAPDPRAAASREIVEAAEDFRRHPELTGFSHPRFQRLIAALARYHGGEAQSS